MPSVRYRHVTHNTSAASFRQMDYVPFQSGFQLLELLIAVAVLSLLVVIAVPSYSNYRDRVDNANSAGDIHAIDQAIERFYEENNHYPDSLNEVNMGNLQDPWKHTYQYLRINGAGLKGVGSLRKDKSLHPLNTDYDLYSMGKDGASSSQIISPTGKDDIIRANNGQFIGLAADY
jgi:general secretion pathway protein G